MEFYRLQSKRFDEAGAVSIPNGMEFYSKGSSGNITIGEFQFPTGWNSTQDGRTIWAIVARVSIPNGMEFYKIAVVG